MAHLADLFGDNSGSTIESVRAARPLGRLANSGAAERCEAGSRERTATREARGQQGGFPPRLIRPSHTTPGESSPSGVVVADRDNRKSDPPYRMAAHRHRRNHRRRKLHWDVHAPVRRAGARVERRSLHAGSRLYGAWRAGPRDFVASSRPRPPWHMQSWSPTVRYEKTARVDSN